VSKPALETAAAVNCPDMADAIVSPAITSMMIRSTIMPNGVLIMPMIEPAADPPLGDNYIPSNKTE